METTIKKPSPKLAIIISLIAILITSGVVVASLLHQQNKHHAQLVAQCQTLLDAYNTKTEELKKLDLESENVEYTRTQCENNPAETTTLVEKAADKITQQLTHAKKEAETKAKLEKEAKEKAEAESKAKAESKANAESKTQPATQSAPPAAPTRNNTPAAKPAPAPKPAPAANTAPVNKPTPPQPAPAPAPDKGSIPDDVKEKARSLKPWEGPRTGTNPDGSYWVVEDSSEFHECTGTTDGKPFDCKVIAP